MASGDRVRRRLSGVRGVGALILFVAVMTLGAAGCGGGSGSSVGSGELVELSTAEPVARAFDEARGTPRLVLLLSPT